MGDDKVIKGSSSLGGFLIAQLFPNFVSSDIYCSLNLPLDFITDD